MPQTDSAITLEFSKQRLFLKRFLTRFFSHPQDIDDVLQDTYLNAYLAERARVINTPKAFLFRVARNAALKELERKSRQIIECIEDLPELEILSEESSVESEVAARQKVGLFCQSALEMSPQVRRVFLMRKVYGFSHKEIASQLGIAVSTVEKHIARGLQICSEYMTQVEQATEAAPVESSLSVAAGSADRQQP